MMNIKQGYPVLVKMSTCCHFKLNISESKVSEYEERYFSCRAARREWLHEDDHEVGMKFIFVSKECFDELNIPCLFMPHWIEGKGWQGADNLSPMSRQELITTVMGIWK